MILFSAFQNSSLLYFYMNFKFIILKYFDDDLACTKLATFIELVGRMAKINSNFILDSISINSFFYFIYLTNLFKNIIFIFWGRNFGIFIALYIVQKIVEGFYYIYNFLFIFDKFENKGSFLMKIFELHKLISLLLSTIIVYSLQMHFEFEKVICILVVIDVVGLLGKRFSMIWRILDSCIWQIVYFNFISLYFWFLKKFLVLKVSTREIGLMISLICALKTIHSQK